MPAQPFQLVFEVRAPSSGQVEPPNPNAHIIFDEEEYGSGSEVCNCDELQWLSGSKFTHDATDANTDTGPTEESPSYHGLRARIGEAHYDYFANDDDELLDPGVEAEQLKLSELPFTEASDYNSFNPIRVPHRERTVELPPGLFETPVLSETRTCCGQATNTNAYASYKNAGQGRPWTPCTAAELKVWIGTLIYLSVFGSGRPDELWKRASDFPYHCISKHMTQTRWEQLKRYFHCSPPSPNLPKAWFFEKLEPLATMLQEAFQKVVKPASCVSIDECMIRFTGRSSHTVIIRGKPVPVGYYVLALCDAGYIYAFSFKSPVTGYIGVDAQSINEVVMSRASNQLSRLQKVMLEHLSATSKAVIHLLTQLPFQLLFHLYCDNLFSIPDLFHILRAIGFAATGTARANCKNWPQDLKKIDRKRDGLPYNSQLVRIVHGDVTAIIWQDKNVVQFLSTGHNPQETIQKERRRPRAQSKWMKETIEQVWGSMSRKVLKLPAYAVDYNDYMGDVDKHDQLRSYNPTQQKAFRTWLSLFFFLLDAAVINSYLICKDVFPSSTDKFVRFQRFFRIRLAWSLINEGRSQMGGFSRQTSEQSRPSNGNGPREYGYVSKHWTPPAIRLSPANHQRNMKYVSQKCCIWCRWKKKQQAHADDTGPIRKTLLYCAICGPRYPLCKDCFTEWHEPNHLS